MGVPALCLDINPVMATFSAAKSGEVIDHDDEIERFFASLSVEPTSYPDCDANDELLSIFEHETARLLRGVIDAIPFRAHKEDDELLDGVHSSIVDTAHVISAPYAFCLAVIFVTIREVSGTTTAANPTWLRAADKKAYKAPNKLIADLRQNASRLLEDVKEFFHVRNRMVPNYAMAADARRLPLRAESVDRVITSPPYLTRIDYAMSTSTEMTTFGGDDLLTFVRHQTMGAPVITKNGRHQKPEWGRLCNAVLDAVKAHPTKAAASYYWKNIVQYFIDLDSAMDEIARVLKPGGRGLIVVQSSYFKEVEIPLGDIYVEMAKAKGLSASIAYREEVKGHLAHVNTKSSVYKKNKVYYEDFVLVEKA